MISDERSFRLTTKIELVEVRELTESTDWFLPFHLSHRRRRRERVLARSFQRGTAMHNQAQANQTTPFPFS
jgi:hypothetical protein